MATTIFDLIGRIMLDGGDRVRRELDDIGGQTERVGLRFNLAGAAMSAAGNLIASGVSKIGELAGATLKAGIDYNALQEQSRVAWTTLLGTQGEAADMMKRISDFAKATPFETADVDMMAKYMHNAGLSGQGLFDALMKVSDVASAFAIPAADAKELTRQMSQVRQAGIAYTEDLNVLQDRGVPIYGAISKQLNITVADVKKLASSGKLTSDIYISAFDSIAAGVQGASDAQSKTFNGMISTMSDNAKILMGTLTAGIFEKAKGFMQNIVDLLQRLNDAFAKGGIKGALEVFFPPAVADAIIASVNALGTALKWIIDNWTFVTAGLLGIGGGLAAFAVLEKMLVWWKKFQEIMVLLREVTLMEAIAQWALNSAMLANPITWIALAIGILIAAAVLLILNWDKVKGWFTGFWAFLKNLWADIVDIFKRYGLLVAGAMLPMLAIPILIYKNWGAISAFLSRLWAQIVGAITTGWNAVVRFLTPALNGIKAFFEVIFFALFFIVYTMLSKLWAWFQPYWNVLSAFVMGIVTTIRDAVVGAWTWIHDRTVAIFEIVKNAISAAWDWILNSKILPVTEGIKNTVSAAWNWLHDNVIAPVMEKIRAFIGAAWDGIKSVFSSALDGIRAVAMWAWNNLILPAFNFIMDGIKGIWNGLVEPLYNIGSNLIQGLVNGISAGWNRLRNAITDIANKGKELWTNIFGIKSPSTFTTFIGRMLGEGLATGIDVSTGGAIAKAKSMGVGVLGALSGSFSPAIALANNLTAGGGGNNYSTGHGRVNLEIPLVVSGKEIARAIAPDIDTELDRRRRILVRSGGGK